MTEQKRNAERLPLDVPFDATAGNIPVRVVEISLIGCRAEHTERLPIGASVPLRFTWKGTSIAIPARVARMELRGFGGGGAAKYESGLKFAESPEEAPATLRHLLESIVQEKQSVPVEFVRAPFLRYDDDEELTSPYVQCVLSGGKWKKRRTSSPKQPVDGFTTIVPSDERELDLLCKSYEVADSETRKLIRLSLEVAMTRKS